MVVKAREGNWVRVEAQYWLELLKLIFMGLGFLIIWVDVGLKKRYNQSCEVKRIFAFVKHIPFFRYTFEANIRFFLFFIKGQDHLLDGPIICLFLTCKKYENKAKFSPKKEKKKKKEEVWKRSQLTMTK